MQSQVLSLPRAAKRAVVLVSDMVLALVATWLAFALRLDSPSWPVDEQWRAYVIAPLLFVPIFLGFGLYRAIFRYTGPTALLVTAKAVALYGMVFSLILLTGQWQGVPRSLGVLQPLLFFLLLAISRELARSWLVGPALAGDAIRHRFLIYGAGLAGVQTASAVAVSGYFELVGFVDDDATKVGRSINGVPVFASGDIPEMVANLQITDILLALPTSSRSRRKEIIEQLRALPVHIRTLPDWSDLASGRVTVQDIKELDIEDLLGRDPVPPLRNLLSRNLCDKTVLVTGAGGSIGSELCRLIVAEQPCQLLLLEHSEYALYRIHQELSKLCMAEYSSVELVPLLGSVSDPHGLAEICQTYRPNTIYHAAAYKHVPLVESNPVQGVLNNVFGTLNLARAAVACGATRFVLVSTDKAVRPTNVMGASKRVAELVLQALAVQGESAATCFCMVRFGNVLGSSGSVVPLFRRQMEQGGPITVTHADVTRYFMTTTEAAQLVLQAGAMASSGEVYVLDMGEPVKIVDLARRMVELSGLRVRDAACPEGDIAIEITGLRPGEKLYEELLIGGDPTPTAHPRILKAHEKALEWSILQGHLDALQQACLASDLRKVIAVLQTCVDGYTPHGVLALPAAH
ncbi:MAG: polysaccharide biosynthesis protein [Rhodoferax sp.]|nr:polysaccharide biosynthesis protein [Rhodoferax sp.]